ncbi:prenyltransferase [Kaarinaea lacus]
MNYKSAIKSIRAPFLLLTPICVFLGASPLIAQETEVNYINLSLVMLGALFAHISVNTLNEYLDYKSGLDLRTKRTDFSGGSGAIPEDPEIAPVVLFIGYASLLLTIIIGLFFVFEYGMALIPLGLVGILIIITYTNILNRNPLLCLIAPGLGFGFLMVIGTQFVLLGEYHPAFWFIATVPFFLVNNLLLLNQYPDIEADASVGRRHFPIVYGVRASNYIFASFSLLTALVITFGVFAEYLPALSLFALVPLILAYYAYLGATQFGKSIGDHPHYLAANVLASLLTPLLLSITIIYG